MTWRRFTFYLLFEVLAVVVAMASFRYVMPRLLAGAIAGVCFVAIGAWIVGAGIRHKELRRSFSFSLSAVHLFLVAIPMMTVRLAFPSESFSDLHIWGLSGPAFHQLSTDVYGVLFFATVIDLLRSIFHRAPVASVPPQS